MSLAEVLRLIRRLVTGGIAGSLAYPVDFVFYMLGTIISPIISAFVWRAAIAAGADLPVDADYITTYFVLLSLVTMLASAWLSIFMADTIRDGRLNVWLARPGSFLYEMAANNIAEKVVKLAILVPMIAIFAWFVRDSLTLDAAPWRWAALLLSTAMAALIFFWLDVAMGSLGFWLEDISGLEWGRSLLTGLITGQMIPLALFPAWMQGFLHVQPFRYTISFPLEIVVSDLSAREVVTGLGVQAGWTAVFVVAGLSLWRRGLHSYAAVGA
ncbi:MAG: ABC-2 family transporter protein [Thermomicrobiales bacterium]